MSDCYCDYDPPVFYLAKIRKARKPHKCVECGGPITITERYENVKALWWSGDKPDTLKTCERCVEIRQWVQGNVPCFCWSHHALDDSCDDAVEDAVRRAPLETVGLRFGLLRRRILRDKHNAAARS